MKNFLSVIVSAAVFSTAYAGVFDVKRFGARGDGSTKDTVAIQKAIDAAHAAGGGEVFLGAGTYVSGSIFLKSNVDFHLGAGATLLASPDKEDYNAADVCVQNEAWASECSSGAHLILCIEQENVTVRGPGKIDGNSRAFLIDPGTSRVWGFKPLSNFWGQRGIPWRPSQMLYFVESRNIRIADAKLKDSPYWSLFLHGCEYVDIRSLDVETERYFFHTHNGDGIDIDSCRYVNVSDCRINTADDSITLRANSRTLKKKRDCAFITVSNCILSTPCNAVRIGVGDGRIHDAVFTGISVYDSRTAVNIVASWNPKASKGVDFENIQLMNWTVDCRELFRIYAGRVAPGVKRSCTMRNILFSGFSGGASKGGAIRALKDYPAENIVLRDVNVPVAVETENADVKIEGGTVRLASQVGVFDVKSFGAKGDGSAKDTAAIQKAIDAAHAAGRGKVTLPAGTYVSGTLFMKSGVELHLEKDAVIKGSTDRSEYCAADAFAQNYASRYEYDNTSGGHLIVAHDCVDIAITGPGRIDGNSAAFLTDASGKQYGNWKKGIPWRPGQMLYIVDCRNVVIENLEMYNSPYWTCHLLNCEKVFVHQCRVRTERRKFKTWNGDGIDIDRCRNVLVRSCDIDTEDDCITLRASCASRLRHPRECRDVRVEYCALSSSCTGIRIGVGEGVIRDCLITCVDIRDTNVGVSFISAYSAGRGTDIHDITLNSINAECRKFLDMRYGRRPGHAKKAVIRDILFKDVKAVAREPNAVSNEPGREFRNIRFENCVFKTTPPEKKPVAAPDPQTVFENPPPSARTGVWWHWMGSYVSKEGIVKDLDWFKRAGIGAATIFGMADICTPWAGSIGNPPGGKLPAFSREWWRLVRFACEEAEKRGIEIGLHNCPGYTSTGGPWIPSKFAMRELVFNVTNAEEQISLTAKAAFPVHIGDTGRVGKPDIPARRTDIVDIGTVDGVKIQHIPMGSFTQPNQWELFGLECDKMNPDAVDFHLDTVISEMKRHLGDQIGRGLKFVLLDSYEAGDPSWTPAMREEFIKRRGYDPLPFLPVLGGFKTKAASDEKAVAKFKKDFERTKKDLYRDVLFKKMHEKLNAIGLEFACEPYSGPFVPHECSRHIDRLMTEFWFEHRLDRKVPGRLTWNQWPAPGGGRHNVVEAEAFTGHPGSCSWNETPLLLKASADDRFVAGINRMTLHTCPHQPWGDDVKPGKTMGRWGTHFGRNQTWAESGAGFFRYLNRCQALLQWGRPGDAKIEGRDIKPAGSQLSTTCRADGDRYVFFVVNHSNHPASMDMALPATDKVPEWFDPVTGEITQLRREGRIVPVQLAPCGSGFLVLRKTKGGGPGAKAAYIQKSPKPSACKDAFTVTTPWSVDFGGHKTQMKKLADWTASDVPAVRYFSGTAAYRTVFTHDGKNASLLSLGDCNGQIARVRLNGRELGTLWCEPYEIPLEAGAVKSGENTLEIEFTNVWANRLIGDEREKPDCEFVKAPFPGGCYLAKMPEWFEKGIAARPSKGRRCFTDWNYFTKDSPLVRSGLLGPVKISSRLEN